MQLHFQTIGSGDPLIFIHGLFGSGGNWRSIAKHFSNDYQVISLDLRNHGRSPHSSQQNYNCMADDLLTLMDSCNLQNAHIIGHSIGGKVAMQFATKHPSRVEKLVVVDIATRAYADEHTHLIDAMLAIDLRQHSSRQGVDSALKAKIPNQMVRQFLLMNLHKTEAGFDWRINLTALKDNYIHLQAAICESSQYQQPCLFVKGNNSDYIREEDKAQLLTHFTKAQFTSLNTGHWIHAEDPKGFIEIVEQFLYA